ncbi:MAG: glucose 1-dehydrogenase [Chloroflexota bacterium]
MAEQQGAGRWDFSGKVAVVTGGSDGIGKGVALGFARAGASVVIAARRPEKLAEAAEDLRATGARVLTVPTDVSDAASVANLAAATHAEFGRADVLVNNAGGSFGPTFRNGPLLELEEADFATCLAVNVTSAFLVSKAFVPGMLERGSGAIINTGSVMAGDWRAPNAPLGVYATAKAALHKLTRVMALEWAPAVRVNCLSAGDIETPRVMAWRDPAEVAATKAKIAMSRFGTPADLASLTLFLASDEAAWITGSVIDINGGL